MGTPLTRYYVHEGSPPGAWYGSGLSGLGSDGAGRISAGDEVAGERLGFAYGRYQTPRQRVTARLAALPEAEREGAAETLRAEERQRKSRQPAGRRLHVSVPKSVSTLWAIADAGTQPVIVQSHHAAMQDVLGFMERDVAATRVGKGGVAHLGVPA